MSANGRFDPWISSESLEAPLPLNSERVFCSWREGWRGVLLRRYKDALSVDDYTTRPTPDQKLVLVTAGSCCIEGHRNGIWRGATYRPGNIGLVAPGEAARLRWRGGERHHTLQLHVPGRLLEDVSRELYGTGRRPDPLQDLSLIDPVVAAALLGLSRAARAGAPEIHAETTAHFLVSHLLLRLNRTAPRPAALPGQSALRRAEDHMRSRLTESVSLSDLAGAAGVGRFQLLRLAKRNWGETPQRRLTRLRMERAQRLLLMERLSVIEVALECGYGNPTHFATAFRRFTGLTPSGFRRGR